jgi:hypothetical protein
MTENRPSCPVETLSLSREEQWTLHHVLLDRLGFGRDVTATAATGPDRAPADAAIRRAFETLDAGERSYTLAELEAMQGVVATYHHSPTWWEVERPQLERLLHQVSTRIERSRGSCRAEDCCRS